MRCQHPPMVYLVRLLNSWEIGGVNSGLITVNRRMSLAFVLNLCLQPPTQRPPHNLGWLLQKPSSEGDLSLRLGSARQP